MPTALPDHQRIRLTLVDSYDDGRTIGVVAELGATGVDVSFRQPDDPDLCVAFLRVELDGGRLVARVWDQHVHGGEPTVSVVLVDDPHDPATYPPPQE